ncbi:hypothetical protein C8263_01775 [Deinococcus arcticus]|uniref:Uncharacterized protein n=1 Tax=Deinococcus arcticus TaxID=2136176 RepID=A0A2T3WD09_9DEIO|nr:hypothetical protein C8263_01775 [Deinococcus arcticus]
MQLLRGGERLAVSRKGLTLLAYLTLEGQALHRETAAALLWPHSSGLQNLRVELSALRRVGVSLGPARAATLQSPLSTDLDLWEEDQDPDLDRWLSALGPAPLSGLDDPAHPALAAWLARGRAALGARVRRALRRRLDREPPARAEDARRRLSTQGWHLDELPGPAPTALAATLAPVLARAQGEVQALLYTGRAASGRGELLSAALRAAGWHPVGVTVVPSVAHLLASLVLQLRRHLSPVLQAEADALLASSAGAERDLVALSGLLRHLGQPVAFVLRGAEGLNEDTARALGFMLNWPATLLLALITTPQGEGRVRAHLGTAAAPGRLTTAEHPPLTPAEVAALLPPGRAHDAVEILRQSEGWWPAARALAATPDVAVRRRLDPALRTLLATELRAALSDPDRLAPLAALPAPFAQAQALDVLTQEGATVPEAEATLRAALRSGILERVPASFQAALAPDRPVRPLDGEQPLAFVSELQRAMLAGVLDASARTRLRTWAPQPLTRTGPVQPWPAQALAAPTSLLGAEVRALGFGYRLLQAAHGFTLLRCGLPEHHAPELALQVGAPPAPRWHWQLAACVARRDAPAHHRPFALRLQRPGQPAPEVLLPALEVGRWVQLSGTGQGPVLEVLCAGANVVLHVANLTLRPEADAAGPPVAPA